MGLYRARLVRFFLGTVVVIAIIQILTTLHFSSIHGNEATSLIQARETRTKRNQPESTTSQVDQGQGKTAVNVQREAQTRVIRNRGADFVLEILNKFDDFNCKLMHKDAKSAISRARSEECKGIIHKTGCLVEHNKLYLNNLKRLCPVPREEGGIPKNVDEGQPYGPPVRVVFMITVHGRALRQVKRLLKSIYHRNHYYYFHVDLRSDYLYRELVELSSMLPNVAVTPWRMATIWGGSTLLQMLLKAIDDLVKKEEWKWDFFINLSESDYPIKTLDITGISPHDDLNVSRMESLSICINPEFGMYEGDISSSSESDSDIDSKSSEASESDDIRSNSHLADFLRAHRDDNFLKSHGRETVRFIRKQGLDRTFVECDEHMWRIGDRVLPRGIEIDGGSDWIGLNKKFAEYIIYSDDKLVAGLKRMYAFALLPAESFFHTVLKNGPLCKSFVKTNLRVTNWKRKLGCRCQYKHVVDWCGCSPNDFKPEDLAKLKKSKYDLFARKFEAIVNQKVINLVDEMLYGNFTPGTPAINTYWENFYHRVDDDDRLNDALRTYFASFNRIATRHVGSKHCSNLPVGGVQEVTYLKQDDEFSGVLVLQNIGLKKRGEKRVLETWLRRVDQEQMMNLNMTEGPARLAGLQVGTSWDQKERMFRNYARLMGPMDDPVLVHYWKKGKPFNVKLMWLDPINVITGVYEMRVEEDWIVSFHKPTYTKPLRPGTWTIKMVYRDQGGTDLVIGQTSFLVIPLAYKFGLPINSDQAFSFNGGPPAGRYTLQFTIEFDREANNIDELAKGATLNSKKTGEELNQWIDGLVKENWLVEDACAVGGELGECNGLARCGMTSWSSRSPDPKSDIARVNGNGTLS